MKFRSDRPVVIGLAGLAGSGKSTVAELLERRGFVRLRFAGPLKGMFRALLSGAVVPADRIERMIEGDLKEVGLPELGGKSPRHAMQSLGNEWGRDCMDADFWVRMAKVEMLDQLRQGRSVVFEDVRYFNEAQMIRDHAGQVWRIEGRGGLPGAHASEQMQIGAARALDNSGALVVTACQVNTLLEGV